MQSSSRFQLLSYPPEDRAASAPRCPRSRHGFKQKRISQLHFKAQGKTCKQTLAHSLRSNTAAFAFSPRQLSHSPRRLPIFSLGRPKPRSWVGPNSQGTTGRDPEPPAGKADSDTGHSRDRASFSMFILAVYSRCLFSLAHQNLPRSYET